MYTSDFKVNKMFVLLLLCILFASLFTSYQVPEMYVYRDRYFMYIYPIYSILTVYLLYEIFVKIIGNKYSILILYTAILCNVLNVNYQEKSPYTLQKSSRDIAIITELKNKKIVVSTPHKWMDEVGSKVYMDAKEVLFTGKKFYFYLTDCFKENKFFTDVRTMLPDKQINEIKNNILESDYVLVYKCKPYSYKIDKNNINKNIKPKDLCNEIKEDYIYLSTVNIGNALFTLYKPNKMKY